MRDAIKPVGEHRRGSDRSRLAGEDEERGLEGVLGIVVVAEDAPADAQDHRPMPPDDRLERRLIATCDEPFEQIAVR